MRVLSICSGMGLLDRAFLDQGFDVRSGCEVDPTMRAMHTALCPGAGDYLCHDLRVLPSVAKVQRLEHAFDGVIGGPPCQSNSKMRSFRDPKFTDLTDEVNAVLDIIKPSWYLLENVVPVGVPGGRYVRLNAMHFGYPHQSRPRWFTYSPNLAPPPPEYDGDIDDLIAYPIVMGRVYGPRRGSVLQGLPAVFHILEAAGIPCVDKQLGLANAVHYGVATAWAKAIRTHGTLTKQMELEEGRRD